MNVRLCMYERDRLSNCGIEDRKWKKRQTANLRLKGSEKESFKREQRGEMKANWYRKKKRKQRKTLEKLYFREFFHGSMRKGNIERERERERERENDVDASITNACSPWILLIIAPIFSWVIFYTFPLDSRFEEQDKKYSWL